MRVERSAFPDGMTGPLNPMHATAPHEWAFVAQGGANLAFGYKGDSVEHHFDGRLLRVRKLNAHPASAELTAEERDKLELGFGTEVVEPLLGSEFVLPVTSHAGDGNWLDELRELLSQSGSAAADRSGGGEVDVAASHIQVVDNLTHGQGTLAIEIKVGLFHLLCSDQLAQWLTARPCIVAAKVGVPPAPATRPIADHADRLPVLQAL